ncbi:hypothetical protein EMCRGX_G032350 [Ephydatia muelleri]
MAVPTQPVICEAQGFSHVLEKLPRAVGDRWKQAVNYTCLDASEAHLALGSEQGIVYVVNVSSGKLVCKLNDREGREQVTQVKLSEKYGYAAYGTKEGTLRIEPATKSQVTKKYTVCEQEKQAVTALTWSRDEPVLYCGYLSGKLVLFYFSFRAETMQATRLPDCGSEVVQLSVCEDLLLISTMARAFLLNTKTLQITQVGRKDRKAGCYGGTFASNGNKVLVARPGLRVFTADSGGQVLHTSIFRDSLETQVIIKLSAQQLPTPTPTGAWQFTFLIPWVSPLVVTYHERVLWVLDPEEVAIVGFAALTHNITDMCASGSILYVLCNGCNPLVTRLTLSEGFMKGKQKDTLASTALESEDILAQPGGEGNEQGKRSLLQPEEESGQKPVKTPQGGAPLEGEALSGASNGDIPTEERHCEQMSGQVGVVAEHTEEGEPPQVTSSQDTRNTQDTGMQDVTPDMQQASEDTSSDTTVTSPMITSGEASTQAVSPETHNSPPPQAIPIGSEAPLQDESLKGEEPLGQDSRGEEEHTGGRTTLRGKLKPIFSNLLLHGRVTNEGMVSGLKDMLKPNMTLIAGLLHKEPEVVTMPTSPATPIVVQPDEKELERIVKMATAEEEESLHVRVGGEQKKKVRRTRRTHRAHHSHAHLDESTVPLGEVAPVQTPGIENTSRAVLPDQDLSVTTSVTQQTLMENRHEEQHKLSLPHSDYSLPHSDDSLPHSDDHPSVVTQQVNGGTFKQTDTEGPTQRQGPIQGQAVETLLDTYRQTIDDKGTERKYEPLVDNQERAETPHKNSSTREQDTAIHEQDTSSSLEGAVTVPRPNPVVDQLTSEQQVESLAKESPSYDKYVSSSPSHGKETSPTNQSFPIPISMETPPISAETPPISAETPPISAETPPISAETPPISAETPPISAESPPISAETPPIPRETLPVMKESMESPVISRDEVAQGGNGIKRSEVSSSPQDIGSSLQDIGSSPQDTGSSPRDDFIDPLNPSYEMSQEQVVAPRGSGEEVQHSSLVLPDGPRANTSHSQAIQKSGSSATADIWCQLPNPSKYHMQCVCISDQLAWATDSKGTTFYSSITSKEVVWHTLKQAVTYVATSASGKVVWGIQKGVARARTGISATHPAGQNWKTTTKTNVTVKQLAVDEDSVWVLKSDGKVMQRKGVTPLIPDGIGWIDITGTEVIAFSFIACCSRVVWALDMSGRPYVRTGISSSNISGSGWATAKSPPLNTVCITSSGIIWVLDKEGMLGFRTGASPDRPEGKGKWWEVAISTQAPMSFVHRLRSVEAMSSLLTMSTEQQSIMSVSAAANTGVCVLDSTNKLHACWRSVTGYRYKKGSKDGMFEVTIWNKVCTSHVAMWLVRYDGCLYCLTTIKGLFPVELVTTVQHIATSPTCIWVVAMDEIWSRQGMTPDSPEGISWDYIELSTMLRERKIRYIACSENAAWVVDGTGVPHFRFGVHPREKGTGMSPAWIPVEGNPKPFIGMAVSPDSLVVWAVDEDGCPYSRTHVTKDFPVGIKWEPVQPEAVQRLCAANGRVFAISKKGELLSRIGITEANPVGNYWRKMPGKNYTFISATPSGEIWVIDAEGGVFVQITTSIAASTELSTSDSKDLYDGTETSEVKDKWEVL